MRGLARSLAVLGLACSWPAAAAPPGDINGNDRVDLADALLALRIVVGLIPPSPSQSAAADTNADGRLDLADVVVLLRWVAGLPAQEPPPKPEALSENQAVKWGEAAGDPGPARLWAVAGVPGGVVVARTAGTPLRFERLAVEGGLPQSAPALVYLAGRLEREAGGQARLLSPELLRTRPLPPLALVLPAAPVAHAVAGVDLGPLSYPTYASATSEACASPTWEAEVAAALKAAAPQELGVTPDGRSLAVTVRGPRLPPLKSIVFRYLRVTGVYDLEQRRLERLLVDVEGWVEE